MTTRFIERFLPIAALSEESTRERRSMTALPPVYYLHVWWARRPLVASRAAILGSLAPENADKDAFLSALGIHGDPVAAANKIEVARRTGVRVDDPYGYERAFKYTPSPKQLDGLLGTSRKDLTVLDVTAGGGAIPFEASRLGVTTVANDLNPVAAAILKATVEYPAKHGDELVSEARSLAAHFLTRLRPKLEGLFPQPNAPQELATTYLWARTINCPHCDGIVPLSPNWRLEPGGVGVSLMPNASAEPGSSERKCSFAIVDDAAEQSPGTVANGDALCPFDDCGRPIGAEEVRRQAQAGQMGDQMFAVVCKRKVEKLTKTGKKRISWERIYRAPTEADDNSSAVFNRLSEKMPEWESLDVIPSEYIGDLHPKWDIKIWNFKRWTDFFSPRQLLAHGFSVETFREMLEAESQHSPLTELRRAAYVYLAIAIDKLLDWNSRQCTWEPSKLRMAHTFSVHGFAFKWSFAEMVIDAEAMGAEWAVNTTMKGLAELVELCGRSANENGLFAASAQASGGITVLNENGANLSSIASETVDAIVMDPPYGANVMYGMLSDFFYVWLKRTAGLVVPELFTRRFTDKEAEAVANRVLFTGQSKPDVLANKDYQDKMSAIFAECRRVLKRDGLMTVMFTHKDTGAWDALAMGLMQAGFVITASWPVNTEAESSLHIKDKAAANSTIFLVCRPRLDSQAEPMYWEDVEPLVASAVRTRVTEFQQAGIRGVDLYLASFGPALEEFSKHWPLTRGTPLPEPKAKRGKQQDMFETFDPYGVRPEDALNAARREVKAWRLSQLASRKAHADMDPATAWVALAWDAFRAPAFAFDEGLRLARAVGLDLDTVIGRLAEKKGSDIKLWDSATRVAKGSLGPADGSRGMIDALHHAAHVARQRGVEAARDLLDQAGVLNDDEFKVALEVMLEVLPPSKAYSGIEADAAVKPAADDFDALEKLRRIVYANQIDAPEQLSLYAAFVEAAE